MSYQIDPLLAYEEAHTKPRWSLLSSLAKSSFFLLEYLSLTGAIFLLLMWGLNYSAYSARLSNWIDPDALLEAQDEVNGILAKATNVVEAGEDTSIEDREDQDTLRNKILEKEPSTIYARSYSPTGLLAGTQTKSRTSFELAPYENRIVIPKIGKNIPLVDVLIDHGANFETMHEVFMEELRKWVVRYPGTALPGETGNVFIFGHSSNFPWVKSEYNDIFALLDKLEKNDEIIIYYMQKKYVYRVTEHAVVKPWDVKTLQSRDKSRKELSLMTCWPIGTTLERIIVFAELIEA